jgi:F420-dependent oxidoreductase-like protein
MKLGLSVGYSGAELALPMDNILLAEKLGYDSLWTAEAYGSDAITPLAYIAAKTERIRLGTGIMQLAGRTAAMCAMQAQTVDALAGGNRVIAGLGVSGPQIVEGWYGEPWGKPYYRLRDYMQIMLKIFAREAPVTHEGRAIVLPYPKDAKGSSGLGKPLMSILHPNPNLPIWLGAGGESTIRLSAELGQGILPLRFAPGSLEEIGPWILEGFSRAGGGKNWDGFEIQASVGVTITEDIESALAARKPQIALYVGGMGARGQNYHNDAMVKAGYAEEAAKIQDLYLAGRKDEAIATVPDGYVERSVLIGSPERIRERYRAWAESGVTGLTINTKQPEVLELMADIAAQTPAIGPAAAMARVTEKSAQSSGALAGAAS